LVAQPQPQQPLQKKKKKMMTVLLPLLLPWLALILLPHR
jgi:hypothetical protein